MNSPLQLATSIPLQYCMRWDQNLSQYHLSEAKKNHHYSPKRPQLLQAELEATTKSSKFLASQHTKKQFQLLIHLLRNQLFNRQGLRIFSRHTNWVLKTMKLQIRCQI